MILQQGDFDAALEGFKPLAIRNVPLHTAGELGWGDIGGLEGVKASLVETLQWPSKVFLQLGARNSSLIVCWARCPA